MSQNVAKSKLIQNADTAIFSSAAGLKTGKKQYLVHSSVDNLLLSLREYLGAVRVKNLDALQQCSPHIDRLLTELGPFANESIALKSLQSAIMYRRNIPTER